MKEALQRLDESGHVAYVVGGSVRDFLLKKESKDHDIATDASPDEICDLFPNSVTVGKAFGVIKVPLKNEPARFLEIATFREDVGYQDHRHPKKVRFAGAIEDARRRDFTINAFFYDYKTSRVLDATGGYDDLKAGVIRAIGKASERFKEDALRLLRAIRFTAALGFELEAETARSIELRAKLIMRVSPERIRDELTMMWAGPRPAEALTLLSEHDLLHHVLPEVEALKTKKLWQHTLKVLRFLQKQNPRRSPALAWAAVLHRVEGERKAAEIAERLKMSRHEVSQIEKMVEEQKKFREAFSMREATLQRFIRQPHFEDLLSLHRADAMALDGNLAYYEFCRSRWEELRKSRASEPLTGLLTGKDLIQLGLQPGPEFSRILKTVEDLCLERKFHDKEEALEYVVKYFVK